MQEILIRLMMRVVDLHNKDNNYFLISVSNRKNLELCMKYAMAGFTNSINGLWTFLEIDTGDYISFLYGARVKNLYRVVKKVAYKNAENLGPWPSVTFKMSGNTYYFPFRLFLDQEREFNEPMVKPEFSYVAENLLLRGGYRKTHFQADTITFYHVSEMGTSFNGNNETIDIHSETFEPKIIFRRELEKIPERFYFKELILQSLIRRKMKDKFLDDLLKSLNVETSADEFEALGEKALPEGFVDLFVKLRHPKGKNKYVLIEVKTGRADKKSFDQLSAYIKEFSREAVGGVLISREFPKNIPNISNNILPVRYYFENLEDERAYNYEELLEILKLEIIP